jgi:hypothetical protein
MMPAPSIRHRIDSPPLWLALARQRSRLHRRATPARSPTPNPLAQRTRRAFKVDSAFF